MTVFQQGINTVVIICDLSSSDASSVVFSLSFYIYIYLYIYLYVHAAEDVIKS